MRNINLAVLLATLLASSLSPVVGAADVPAEPPFAIKRYDVAGNTVLDAARVEALLAGHAGAGRRFADIEAAPAEGLYFTVFEGAIALANAAGETTFPEGKPGYVRDANSKPIELPKEPGLVREFPVSVNPAGAGSPFGGAQGACLVR
jgi:hypothetical protein